MTESRESNDRPTRLSEEEFSKRRDDIADRSFNLKVKGYLISGALAAAAVGAVLFFPPAAAIAMPLVAGSLVVGSGVAAFVTMKESKKLQLDEENLRNYSQGTNMGEQWEGYSRYVGHGLPPAGYGPPGRGQRSPAYS